VLVQPIPTNARQIRLAVEQAYGTEIQRILLNLPISASKFRLDDNVSTTITHFGAPSSPIYTSTGG
jgi:hypothetical protein